MASNAESSMSNIDVEGEGARPQAGPLPRKRGEIGFEEGVDFEHGAEESGTEVGSLPERHPADTQLSPQQTAAPSNDSPTPSPDAPQETSDASSTTKIPKNKILSFFGKLSFGGISLGSYIRLVFQLAFIGGTVAAWVLITKHLLHGPSLFSSSPPSDSEDDDDDDSTSGSSLGGSTSIFVHVTFALAVLGQLIFLERCVFHMRAQRYAFKHPGAALPTTRSTGRTGMGFAPWNRPSLPTYAAALAQSGLGTGDVEDNLIAIPPPPAYGNTRGSTLLLRGFLRNSLREAISTDRDSQHRMSVFSQRSSRPVSYHSQDGDAAEHAERSDARRAMRLAETLQQLEEGQVGDGTSRTAPVHEGENPRNSTSQGQ